MKCVPDIINLHGLSAQVLLWTMLPLTILLIVFSLTGINSHQNSMHALAAEENTRLVTVLSRAIAVQVENYRLRTQSASAPIPADALQLEMLLNVGHANAVVTVLLVDREGNIVFGSGEILSADQLMSWNGIDRALAGDSGVVFEPDTIDGDVIAFAPVPGTGWALLIREPWHALTVPLLRIEQAMPLVLLSATVISFLTLFFGLNSVVRPLRALTTQANRIGQGDFEAAAQPVGGVKEIEDLRQTMSHMAQRIRAHQTALQDYLRSVTQTQEEERARLARELHDETVQTLIALGHKAQKAQRGLERNSGQTVELIGELRQMIASAIEEVRRFSRVLRPLYLEELGLIPALEGLARDADAEFRLIGSPHRLDADKELALYRIAQEALNNARRHAGAQHVSVQLGFEPTGVSLTIQDDGVGFDFPQSFSQLTRGGHFGLMGMHERAQLVGGHLTVVSSSGRGTTIRVIVPI